MVVGTYCPAVYDEPREPRQPPENGHGLDRPDTHTCDQLDGHAGPHHCDLCGKWWSVRIGVESGVPSGRGGVRLQVAQARMDAHLLGTGWVRITRGMDGGFDYRRVAPDRVMVAVTEDEAEDETDGG